MKAIRVSEKGGPEVLKLEDIPDPTPGKGEVLIDIEAIGINFIEVYHRIGLYDVPKPLPSAPKRPEEFVRSAKV